MRTNSFSSELVSKIRENDGVYKCVDGREIILPKTFGFCTGVFNAVSKLSDATAKFIENASPSNIWLLGAMIHNPAVNSHFVKAGVHIADFRHIDQVFEAAHPSDTFVIPAFGLPIDVDERLRSFVSSVGCIVDATCPFVRRVWEAARQAGNAGHAVVIHGKFGHQETNAIWSRAVRYSGCCVLLTTPKEAQAFAAGEVLPEERTAGKQFLAARNWTLINQTTMLSTETAEIGEILKNATWHKGDVVMAGTLCPATRDRQHAASTLCQAKCECIFVLGGTDSSNTTQLYRMAADKLGEGRSFFVGSADDISAGTIRHYLPQNGQWMQSPMPDCQKIGILTGASCPDSELEKLIIALSK